MGEGYKVAPKEAKPYPPGINVKGSPTPKRKVDVSKTPIPSTPRTPNPKNNTLTDRNQKGNSPNREEKTQNQCRARTTPREADGHFSSQPRDTKSTRHGLTFSWSYGKETYFLYRNARAYRVTRGNLKYRVIWKVSSHSTKNGANGLIIHHNQTQCTTIPACQNFGRRHWYYRDSGKFIEICSLSHMLKTLLCQNQSHDGTLR